MVTYLPSLHHNGSILTETFHDVEQVCPASVSESDVVSIVSDPDTATSTAPAQDLPNSQPRSAGGYKDAPTSLDHHTHSSYSTHPPHKPTTNMPPLVIQPLDSVATAERTLSTAASKFGTANVVASMSARTKAHIILALIHDYCIDVEKASARRKHRALESIEQVNKIIETVDVYEQTSELRQRLFDLWSRFGKVNVKEHEFEQHLIASQFEDEKEIEKQMGNVATMDFDIDSHTDDQKVIDGPSESRSRKRTLEDATESGQRCKRICLAHKERHQIEKLDLAQEVEMMDEEVMEWSAMRLFVQALELKL